MPMNIAVVAQNQQTPKICLRYDGAKYVVGPTRTQIEPIGQKKKITVKVTN